ncbi:MAG: putative lipid II flippase FtsW [Steroidobacteraceae bacterium]
MASILQPSIAYSRSAGRQGGPLLDGVLLSAALGILLLGLVMVASASVGLAERQGLDSLAYFYRQAFSAGAGLIAGAAMLMVPTATWQRLSTPLLAVGLMLLLLVALPWVGHEVNGSRRWIRLGGFNFQPSEPARVALLIYLCAYVVRCQAELASSTGGMLRPLVVLGLAALLLLLEPDLGGAIVLVTTGLVVLFLAGARLRDSLVVAGLGVVGVIGLVVSADYRLRRWFSFVDPWSDAQDSGYQLTQSLIAIGRGGGFGVGLGSSVQKLFYLPEAHTDFVFAVLAEEFGLVGVFILVLLFAVVVLRSLRLARLGAEAGMPFHACMAAAFGVWLAVQAFVNIGVNMGLLPTKGLTLPLMSYGRSSLLVTLAWLGIVMRIHHEVMASGRVATGRDGS